MSIAVAGKTEPVETEETTRTSVEPVSVDDDTEQVVTGNLEPDLTLSSCEYVPHGQLIKRQLAENESLCVLYSFQKNSHGNYMLITRLETLSKPSFQHNARLYARCMHAMQCKENCLCKSFRNARSKTRLTREIESVLI